MRPTLTLFCGLPGSGKTTLAKELESAGRGIRICTDDWQAELGVDHSDGEFHERLQARLYRHALELLRHGQDVILEDGLWMRAERAEKLADAELAGARTEMHVFDLSLDEVWRRLQGRNQGRAHGAVSITRAELDAYGLLFQLPDDSELRLFDDYTIHR
jgi:predicted kinase